MSLKHILRRCAQHLGYQGLADNPEHRQALVDIVNEAAELVYEEADVHDCLGEFTVVVDPDVRELALPPFVGELRAVREARENLGSSSSFGGERHKWSLLDMRPRYQISEWRDLWRNFRMKGYSPLAANLGTGTKLGFKCQVSEPTLPQITVVGSTVTANWVSEVVQPDNCDTPTYTQNVFTNIKTISKTARTQGDILIVDIGENELGVFYNNYTESQYQIVEMSQYPFLPQSNYAANQRLVDVLFKKPFIPFNNDNDDFPIHGFDDIIFNKVLQLKAELQPGAEKRALLQEVKVTKRINQKGRDRTGHIKRRLMFSRPAIFDFADRYTTQCDVSGDYIKD